MTPILPPSLPSTLCPHSEVSIALNPWSPCLLESPVPWGLPGAVALPDSSFPPPPRGYLYAGLEFGAECYCGHKIQAANVSESDCDMECKGERGSVCGGINRLSVYRLQLAQESARRCT